MSTEFLGHHQHPVPLARATRPAALRATTRLTSHGQSGNSPRSPRPGKAGPDSSPSGVLRRGRERTGPPGARGRSCVLLALPTLSPQRGWQGRAEHRTP